MNTTQIIVAIALAFILFAVLMPVGGQITPPPDQDCIDAGKWHRQQALKWSQARDQEYHLLAAQASDELADSGGNCDEWRSDRGAPTYTNGATVNP